MRYEVKVSERCDQPLVGACAVAWQPLARRILLSDYIGVLPQAGTPLAITARLKRPRGFANPHTFDYEAWLWQQDISAVGYVTDMTIDGPARVSWQYRHLAWRAGLKHRLDLLWQTELPGGLARSGVLRALTLGLRDDISAAEWQLFNAHGISHLVVISGLHTGLVCWLASLLAGRLWSCSATLVCLVPTPRVAAAAALVAGISYCALAGFALPAVRSMVMAGVVLLAGLLRSHTRVKDSLFTALFLVLLCDPLAVLARGFWLSFGAVLLLLWCLPQAAQSEPLQQAAMPANARAAYSGWGDRLLALVRVQLVLFIGLLPAMMLLTGQSSLSAPLVNLIAVPLVGLIVVPLCLAALLVAPLCAPVAAGFFLLADCLLEGLFDILTTLLELWPRPVWQFPAPLWWQWPLLGLACIAIVLPEAGVKRLASVPILMLSLTGPPKLEAGQCACPGCLSRARGSGRNTSPADNFRHRSCLE